MAGFRTRCLVGMLAAGLSMGIQAQDAVARPTIGDFGFDTAGMDRNVPPGQDFYAYASGGWARATPIPASKANYGQFARLADINTARVGEILTAATKDPSSRIGAAYTSYLDVEHVEKLGILPFRPWLARIDAVHDLAGYRGLLADAAAMGIVLPISVEVGPDDGHPDTYIPIVSQSGLGMPDRSYYLADEAPMPAVRQAYVTWLARALTFAGQRDVERRARAVLAFETAIAKVSWTPLQNRDATKTYNRTTLAELAKKAPGFDIAALFAGHTPADDAVVAMQPDAIAAIAAIVAKTPVDVLKDALRVQSLHAYASFLPDRVGDADFAFYGKVIDGSEAREPRKARAADFVVEAMPDDVSRIYVARWFTPETKAAALAMVKNIITAMDKRLDALAWMTPATKARAHAKLAAFTPRIGYPDRWHDYDGLTMRADDLFGNAIRARRWHRDWELGRIGKPLYRWEWSATPMTVDAFANYPTIGITFPAAILQPPFFDPHADPAINYGGIGAVIGHEMSHQFDDQGAKYDEKGRLATWWTQADIDAFHARTDALVKQFSAYEPLPGMHIDGKLTLGENIADLAGLTVAYDAYKASPESRNAKTIDGFTPDQRFFLGWAQLWRLSYRDADLRRRLLTNGHAPAVQRVWTVRNLDPWYDAYRVTAEQSLYLPPERRVRIW
ncbi:MAG: Neutral endopeptidase [Luteibacter sp.]|uniref:M13 family metallopeptidase n=1 Tax=Luteibacter sp. TaxID=1886636 RepID=UPI001385DA96|nr:M13 family metallopeptidase [Luteibacter sp.]KAF1008438.1 MAG: Neutral endopeptidase [Luteibacter sp.]